MYFSVTKIRVRLSLSISLLLGVNRVFYAVHEGKSLQCAAVRNDSVNGVTDALLYPWLYEGKRSQFIGCPLFLFCQVALQQNQRDCLRG